VVTRSCCDCCRQLDLSAFSRQSKVCRSCVSGRQRFGALARSRPHVWAFSVEVQDFVRYYETARLAFTRALRPFGLEVTWRGFEPVVRVRPGSRLSAPAVD